MAGKRGRSGRPSGETKLFSDEIIKNVKAAAERLKEKHEIPIEEAALGLIYDAKIQGSVKASIFKSYCDCFVEKSTKQKVDIEKPFSGPTIYEPISEDDPDIVRIIRRGGNIMLPEIKSSDPALLIENEGGYKND